MFPANHVETGSKPIYQANARTPKTDNDSDKVASQPEVKKADSHATRHHDSKTVDQRNVCHAESSLPSKSNIFHEDASGRSQDEKEYIHHIVYKVLVEVHKTMGQKLFLRHSNLLIHKDY